MISVSPAPSSATKFIRVGESENRVALGYVRRRGCSDLGNCFAKQALYSLLARIVPPGEGDPTTSLERSDAFSDGGFRIGEVSQAKIANDRIERAIRKRQMRDPCDAEVNVGTGFCSKLDHPRREIDANGPGT